MLYAWPDRKHLNDLWGVEVNALVVIEWNEAETAEWVADAKPVQLLGEGIVESPAVGDKSEGPALVSSGVDGILEYIASMAAGYSSGLKWNEEDKLKADMMNRPDRWAAVTVDQVRAKCQHLGMRPNDIDTVAGFLQRRKEGRRFKVGSSYRTFHFN